MLDMWHIVSDGTLWQGLLSETVGGVPVEALLLAVIGIPAALILWHFLRVLFLRSFGRKYRAITILNQLCEFDAGIRERYEYRVTLNSRKQLERYDFDVFFLNEFGRDPNQFTAILTGALNNERRYRKYQAEVERVLGVRPGDTVRVRFFDPLEVKLCKRRLKSPVTSPVFHCTAEYTSPKGKSHYTRTADYSLRQMEAVGRQYRKNVDFQQSKAYQRSLMTDSLRYDIMKRDNFRCVLCGRTAKEGVKLHVDHIIPVSKGGLTVPDNLRTLCDQCNLGKSDKYDPGGVN